jgi:hypothetical protein
MDRRTSAGRGIRPVERGQLAGKASLRAGMFRLAKKSATMAIFLSSHYLGLENYRGAAAALTAADGDNDGFTGTEVLNRRIAQLRQYLITEYRAQELERRGPAEADADVALDSPPEATSPGG